LDEGTYEVLAEDAFLLQVQPAEDQLYFLNTKDEIRKVLR